MFLDREDVCAVEDGEGFVAHLLAGLQECRFVDEVMFQVQSDMVVRNKSVVVDLVPDFGWKVERGLGSLIAIGARGRSRAQRQRRLWGKV